MSKSRFECLIIQLTMNMSCRTARVSIGVTEFLIYINDVVPEGLNSEVKLFADDTSLFSIGNCANTSASTLNNSDLLKIMD